MDPSEITRLNEMESRLTPEQFQDFARRAIKAIDDGFRDYLAPLVAERATLSAREERAKVGCTLRVIDTAADLANRWEESPETVILKGLLLYRMAREAAEKGNSLVIIDREDTVVENITNIEDPAPARS